MVSNPETIHKRACGKCERTLPIIDNQKIRPPRHDEPELVLLFASPIPVRFGLCARSVLNLHDRIHGSQVAARVTVGHPTSGRDFFSTHFDINYLPENQARTEALWETSENGGRAAYDDGRRVTFVARFCWSRGECVFKRGAGRNPNPTLSRCRGPDFVNEFYKRGCQEKISASTGAEKIVSRDPAH